VLWAWERREDLGFVDPDRVGVAFLAGTVRLEGDAVGVRPRRQLLAVSEHTRTTPVVRIESARGRPPSLAIRQRAEAVDAVASLLAPWAATEAQVDFDAARSEREFYRAFLTDLRARLPPATRLSMTALASWCVDDPWLEGLPVDLVVPMLFRMGPEGAAIRQRVIALGDLPSPRCRAAVGLAEDEPIGLAWSGRRVYLFGSRPWSPASYARALAVARGGG